MWEGEVGDGSHVLVPQGKAGSVSAQELGPYLTGCIFLLSGCCRGMQHERVCIWARIGAVHPQQAPDSRGTRAVPSHEGIRVRVSAAKQPEAPGVWWLSQHQCLLGCFIPAAIHAS